ncbi:hypothetical protein HK104_005704 [Borealophlyctis nickersoniae]|nr:hypothetical protein HK104_005704 [Borealophlyctis nickersoniae]
MAKGKQKKPLHKAGSAESLSEDHQTDSSSVSVLTGAATTSNGGTLRKRISMDGTAGHGQGAGEGGEGLVVGGSTDAVPPSSTPTTTTVTGAPVTLLVDEPKSKKWQNAFVRGIWTLVMIFGFLAILMAGHVWVVLLVVATQTLVYKEVISIGIVPSKERRLPWNRTIHWYFLLSTNYFLYGESIIHYFKESVLVDAFLMPLATHHRFISFSLYCMGLVVFVLNLRKGHYKFQFSQFGWTHITLLLVVCTSHFIINNIFEGLVWFVLPVSLVICNDITAYVCGFFWGRTQLIRISPKKTWEGFIGALVCTVIFGFVFSGYLAQFPYMYCPLRDPRTSSITGVTCTPNPVFVASSVRIPPAMMALLRRILRALHTTPPTTLSIYPIQLHAIVMALFASLVAPFGGFFASGFKRAFKIKDFGDSIPGHGGITDRMDCQFLMGLFSYMYYQSFIGAVKVVTVGKLLEMAVQQLTADEQIELWKGLREYLIGQELLPDVAA